MNMPAATATLTGRTSWGPSFGIALMFGLPMAMAADKPVDQAVNEARLEGQIGTAILLNRHLNPFEIDVDVEGNTAILTGTVDEAIDRELAERVAMNARGIARVDNRIVVDAAVIGRDRRADDERDFGEAIEDASITAAVKSRLLWNDTTDGLDIDVDTMHGRVTLKGTASTAAEKELATRLAQRTAGVRGVDNRIEVRAGEDGETTAGVDTLPVNDAWITAKVKASLMMSANVDGLDLKVETSNGVVTLSGEASSTAERDLAIEIARDIRGVKDVNAAAVRVNA